MSEGFKEYARIEREIKIDLTVSSILTTAYGKYRETMTDYERDNVEGEFSRLKEDKSQSFGVYFYLRSLANRKKRSELCPVSESYIEFINAAASKIMAELPFMENDMRRRLLSRID